LLPPDGGAGWCRSNHAKSFDPARRNGGFAEGGAEHQADEQAAGGGVAPGHRILDERFLEGIGIADEEEEDTGKCVGEVTGETAFLKRGHRFGFAVTAGVREMGRRIDVFPGFRGDGSVEGFVEGEALEQFAADAGEVGSRFGDPGIAVGECGLAAGRFRELVLGPVRQGDEEGRDAGGAGEVVRVGRGFMGRLAGFEIGEGALGGTVDISGIVLPHRSPAPGERFQGKIRTRLEAAQELHQLVAVVGEVTGLTGSVVGTARGVEEVLDAAVEAGDFAGIVDPVDAQGEGVAGAGAQKRAAKAGAEIKRGHHGGSRLEPYRSFPARGPYRPGETVSCQAGSTITPSGPALTTRVSPTRSCRPALAWM